MIQLRELDQITYRAPLAVHFVDAVTNQSIRNGLQITAWPFVGSERILPSQEVHAEKSPNSALYGFRSLPGLERYQMGDDITPESLQFVIIIEDQLDRFLPQIQLVDLPLANLAPQEVVLFSAPTRPIPTGYGVIRGDLRQTTEPDGPNNQISVMSEAGWARVTFTIDGTSTQTFSDRRGRVLGLVPLPTIVLSTPLSEAEWLVTVSVEHSPASIGADINMIAAARPDLDVQRLPPFLNTLQSQSSANLFADVSVVDAAAQTYNVNGATNATSANDTIQFAQPLVIQTSIDGGPDHLSEFLIRN